MADIAFRTPAKPAPTLTTAATSLLRPDVERNSPWAKRYRQLYGKYVADLGGGTGLSEGQRQLVRRCAAITIELEFMETKLANARARGRSTRLDQIEIFQRALNTQKRLLESLGIHRGRIAAHDAAPSLSSILRGEGSRGSRGSRAGARP